MVERSEIVKHIVQGIDHAHLSLCMTVPEGDGDLGSNRQVLSSLTGRRVTGVTSLELNLLHLRVL